MALMELLDLPVHQAQTVLRVHQARTVLLVLMDKLVLMVLPEHQVLTDPQDLLVLLVLLDYPV